MNIANDMRTASLTLNTSLNIGIKISIILIPLVNINQSARIILISLFLEVHSFCGNTYPFVFITLALNIYVEPSLPYKLTITRKKTTFCNSKLTAKCLWDNKCTNRKINIKYIIFIKIVNFKLLLIK